VIDLTWLKQLLELGWPGIVTAFLCVMAWRYYNDTRDEIAYLRTRIEALEKIVASFDKAQAVAVSVAETSNKP
jgi:hypothetical protein